MLNVPQFNGYCTFGTCQYIALSIALFLWFCMLPLLVYNVSKYIRLRKHPCIRKRHPSLVLSIYFVSLALVGMERPSYLLTATKLYNAHWLRAFHLFVFVAACQSTVWLLLLKYWLTYFDLSYANSLRDNQWKLIIQEASGDIKSFFISNHVTLGNAKFLLKFIFVPFISIMTLIIYTLFFQSIQIGNYTNMGILLIGVLLICVVWNKTPEYNDVFKIRS